MAKPRTTAKAKPTPAKAKPAKAKPAKAKPAKAKPAKATPVKAKPKAKPAKAKPAKAKPTKAEAKPAKVANQPANAKPAKPANAKPGKAKPAKPARTAKTSPARPVPGTTKPKARHAHEPSLEAAEPTPAETAAAPDAAAPDVVIAPEQTRPSGGQIVQILDAAEPIDALREFFQTIDSEVTVRQGQVALGSAQLMLFAIEREHRGDAAVKELLDLMLERWSSLPERAGFHAQGFLRNAFAAVGEDRDRLARLLELVPPDASPELQYNIACAHAFVGDKHAMLDALASALAAGASAEQVRRDHDFAPFADDPELEELLAGPTTLPIPLDITPHVWPVRDALDALVTTLRGLGAQGTLNPPASLDQVLVAERARNIQLPNDYRALLTIADGLKLWDNEFFGTEDYQSDTQLAHSATAYLARAVDGRAGLDACVPLANWGQPDDWLFYDPRGEVRGGEPGYVLMLNADEMAIDDLVAALDRLTQIARDVLGTN